MVYIMKIKWTLEKNKSPYVHFGFYIKIFYNIGTDIIYIVARYSFTISLIL